MSATTRERAYAWEDQTPTMLAAGTQDGLAILQAIGREELPLPPALRTLDIVPVEAEPGRVIFTLQPAEFHLNPFGLVHGGVLAALIDTAMGCAVHSLLPVGVGTSPRSSTCASCARPTWAPARCCARVR